MNEQLDRILAKLDKLTDRVEETLRWQAATDVRLRAGEKAFDETRSRLSKLEDTQVTLQASRAGLLGGWRVMGLLITAAGAAGAVGAAVAAIFK